MKEQASLFNYQNRFNQTALTNLQWGREELSECLHEIRALEVIPKDFFYRKLSHETFLRWSQITTKPSTWLASLGYFYAKGDGNNRQLMLEINAADLQNPAFLQAFVLSRKMLISVQWVGWYDEDDFSQYTDFFTDVVYVEKQDPFGIVVAQEKLRGKSNAALLLPKIGEDITTMALWKESVLMRYEQAMGEICSSAK